MGNLLKVLLVLVVVAAGYFFFVYDGMPGSVQFNEHTLSNKETIDSGHGRVEVYKYSDDASSRYLIFALPKEGKITLEQVESAYIERLGKQGIQFNSKNGRHLGIGKDNIVAYMTRADSIGGVIIYVEQRANGKSVRFRDAQNTFTALESYVL